MFTMMGLRSIIRDVMKKGECRSEGKRMITYEKTVRRAFVLLLAGRLAAMLQACRR
jgi:hypothetical protein